MPYEQYEKMSRKYMNRFAIEEDDQFEIHVKDHTKDYEVYQEEIDQVYHEEIYNAAKEVILKAQQGSGYYCL